MLILYNPIAKRELDGLNTKVKRKFRALFTELHENNKLNPKHFKKLSGQHSLYELRVKHDKEIYRSICGYAKHCFLVVLFFQKKSRKIPSRYVNNAVNRLKSFRNMNQNEN